MQQYEHKVQYYETDKMAIVHHSNYIRWFESARIDYLDKIGIDYVKLEAEGLVSPVLEVECKYRNMVRFGDTVIVETRLSSYNGIKFSVEYVIKDKQTQQVKTTGFSSHCFLTNDGKPVSLKRSCKWADELLKKALEDELCKES